LDKIIECYFKEADLRELLIQVKEEAEAQNGDTPNFKTKNPVNAGNRLF